MNRRPFAVSNALTALCVLFICSTQALAAPTYTITDLGALPGGTSSSAYVINANSQVVGTSSTLLTDMSSTTHGFLWTNGQMVDLSVGQPVFSLAYGLNDGGLAVGQTQVDSGAYHAVMWQNGAMTDLGALDDPTNNSNAYSINAGGQIVGWSFVADGTMRAFLYSGGAMTDLGVLPNGGIDSCAHSINVGGQIVGFSTDGTGKHAVLWNNGAIQDLGIAGVSVAYWINDSGQIVGAAGSHPFLLSNGAFTDLGTLGGTTGTARGINNHGLVVGEADASAGKHAFLWQAGAMADLNGLIDPNAGWVLISARSINDKGQIVGLGSFNGVQHAFLLDPISDVSPPTTTATLSGPTGNNGWYTGDVKVTLTAIDPDGAADVAATYTLDGGVQQKYQGPFTISGDGLHTLSFWSVDQHGNEEAHKSLTVQIDGTAPSMTASADPSRLRSNGKMVNVTISGKITDSTSGVDPSSATFAVTDSYGQIQPSGQVQVGQDGSYKFTVKLRARHHGHKRQPRNYTITVKAADMAGNTGTASTVITVPHDRRHCHHD